MYLKTLNKKFPFIILILTVEITSVLDPRNWDPNRYSLRPLNRDRPFQAIYFIDIQSFENVLNHHFIFCVVSVRDKKLRLSILV